MSAPEPARAAAAALALLSILLVTGCFYVSKPLPMGRNVDGQSVYYVEMTSGGSQLSAYISGARREVEPICAKEGRSTRYETYEILGVGAVFGL